MSLTGLRPRKGVPENPGSPRYQTGASDATVWWRARAVVGSFHAARLLCFSKRLRLTAMSDLQHIRVEWDDDLALVYIDRPEKLNALNAEVVQELGQVFRELRDDDQVLGVILSGAGDKAFVAGADIGELAKMAPMSGVTVSREGQRVFAEVERYPKPVLAAVGGYALGGGCELALACHLRIASENARFGLPEVGLGIIPGYGGTLRLARLIGLGRAIEMTLTGAMVDASKAEAIGLVSQVLPREDLIEGAKTFMRCITKNGPLAVRMALESIYLAMDSPAEVAMRFESSLFGLLASTEDMKEGMTAFLEKRAANFKGK